MTSTIGSTVGLIARDSFTRSQGVVNNVATRLSTGLQQSKWSDNLFNAIEGSISQTQLAYTKNALSTLTRMKTILSVHAGSLQNMLDNLTEISSIAQQSSGSIPDDIRSANKAVVSQLFTRVKDLAVQANYAGTKVLDGSMSGDNVDESLKFSSLQSSSSHTVGLRESGIEQQSLGYSLNRSATLRITNMPLENDTVTIGGVQLRFSNIPSGELDVEIGENQLATAMNLFEKINSLRDSEYDSLRQFNYSRSGDTITITRLASGSTAISGASTDTQVQQSSPSATAFTLTNVANINTATLTLVGVQDNGINWIDINGVKFTFSDEAGKYNVPTGGGDASAGRNLVARIHEIIRAGGEDADKLRKLSITNNQTALGADGAVLNFTTLDPTLGPIEDLIDNRFGVGVAKIDVAAPTNVALPNITATLTFNAGEIPVDKTININGVTLKAAAAINVGAREFDRGLNFTASAEGVFDLIERIINEGGEDGKKLARYEYSRAGAVITLTDRMHGAEEVLVTSSHGNAAVVQTAAVPRAVQYGFDFSNYRSHSVSGDFKFLEISNGVYAADAPTVTSTLEKYGIATVGVGANSRLMEITFKIGEDTFTGVMHYNAGNIFANPVFTCKKLDDDISVTGSIETFTFALPYINSFGTLGSADEAQVIADAVKADFDKLKVNQDRYYGIRAVNGDIKDNGTVVGSLDGFSLSLNASDFSDVTVDDLSISYSAAGAGDTAKLTYYAKISGIEYELSQTAAATGTDNPTMTLAPNTSLLLTRKDGGTDTLRINVGNKKVILNTESARESIELAWKSGLMSDGLKPAKFLVGTSLDETMVLNFSDMRWSALGGDYQLSIEDSDKSEQSFAVIQEAIKMVTQELAVNAAYDKAVQSLTQQLDVSQENLTAAVETLLKVDPAQAREEMDNALSSMQSAISVLLAQQEVASLANSLLRR